MNCDLFWISSTNHRQLCQMPNIWHLRHQTLKTKHCVKCIKILRYITVTFHLSFFTSLHLLCSRLYLLLSFSRTSTSPFFFLFSPLFSFSVTFSLRFRLLYLFFFFSLSLSFSIFFFFLRLGRCHWDRPSWVRPRCGVQPHQWGRCRGDILLWSPSVFLFFFIFFYFLFFIVIMGCDWVWWWRLCCVWCDFVEDFEFFFFFFPLLLWFLFRMKE